MATSSFANSGVVIIGDRRKPMQDLYHLWLRTSWVRAIVLITIWYLIVNTLFACVYMWIGGVSNSRGDFFDSLFFSVETMGTIGYGEMAPASRAAHAVVMVESITGTLLTALGTGLVFAKFSLPTARLAFSKQATISPMNGAPTLALRVGNERSNVIAEARIRMTLVRTEVSREGVRMYRMYDLALVRDHSQALTRSWTVMHVIEPSSPLYGVTPETMQASEIELLVSVVGTDETSLQPVHGRHRYLDGDVVWGGRHVDILTELEDGTLRLDIGRFHEVAPTEPSSDFPYPRPTKASLSTSKGTT
jgi:inward rectifier potassium channel